MTPSLHAEKEGRNVNAGRDDHAPRGQIIVIFAVALIAIISIGALILEGGQAFAQQRIAQNGADAAANAGAVVIAQHLKGAPAADGNAVYTAVSSSTAANELANPVAVYTDNVGVPLDPVVTVAPGTAIPANGRGVKVTGDRVMGTTLARVIGINSLTASAEATAIAGAASGGCPPDTPVA